MWRATAKTPEEVADGPSKYGYYVSRFQVRELILLGFNPTLTEHFAAGHVSIPELSYHAVKGDENAAEENMRRLAKLAWQRRILGPTTPR
jgi:hypothetical protein